MKKRINKKKKSTLESSCSINLQNIELARPKQVEEQIGDTPRDDFMNILDNSIVSAKSTDPVPIIRKVKNM